jgi:exodeoxyribonuclease VII large subunit
MPRADDLFAMSRRVFDEVAARLGRGLLANARVHRTQFERAAGRLSLGGLERLIARVRDRLSVLSHRRDECAHRRIERVHTRLLALGRLLEAVSYRSVLERGFALVSDSEGTPLRSVTVAPPGRVLDIEFHDGHVSAIASGPAPPRRRRRLRDDDSQGRLL